MPRETREQRQAREALEQAAAEEALREYYLSVPKRLMDAQALAKTLNIDVDVKLTENGPSIRFHCDDGKEIYLDETLTYKTEQWELESLERRLITMKSLADAKANRYKLAQSVFDTMTNDVKEAIKEHIYALK